MKLEVRKQLTNRTLGDVIINPKDPKNLKLHVFWVPTAEGPVSLMKTILQQNQDQQRGKELANRVIRKAKSMNNFSLKDAPPLGPQDPQPEDPGDW